MLELLLFTNNEEPVVLDLVIVLAGTNDLRHKPNSAANRDAIIGSIQEIHKAARRRAIPTIALAIPPSGFHSGVGDLAEAVNEAFLSYADDVRTTQTGSGSWFETRAPLLGSRSRGSGCRGSGYGRSFVRSFVRSFDRSIAKLTRAWRSKATVCKIAGENYKSWRRGYR